MSSNIVPMPFDFFLPWASNKSQTDFLPLSPWLNISNGLWQHSLEIFLLLTSNIAQYRRPSRSLKPVSKSRARPIWYLPADGLLPTIVRGLWQHSLQWPEATHPAPPTPLPSTKYQKPCQPLWLFVFVIIFENSKPTTQSNKYKKPCQALPSSSTHFPNIQAQYKRYLCS